MFNMHAAFDLSWLAVKKLKISSILFIYQYWHDYSSNVNKKKKNHHQNARSFLYMQVFKITNTSLQHDVTTVNRYGQPNR